MPSRSASETTAASAARCRNMIAGTIALSASSLCAVLRCSRASSDFGLGDTASMVIPGSVAVGALAPERERNRAPRVTRAGATAMSSTTARGPASSPPMRAMLGAMSPGALGDLECRPSRAGSTTSRARRDRCGNARELALDQPTTTTRAPTVSYVARAGHRGWRDLRRARRLRAPRAHRRPHRRRSPAGRETSGRRPATSDPRSSGSRNRSPRSRAASAGAKRRSPGRRVRTEYVSASAWPLSAALRRTDRSPA